MKKEWADKWVADLRDPANKQCRTYLENNGAFCCLGRLCIITGTKRREHCNGFGVFGEEDEGYLQTLPPEITELVGLKGSSADNLANMNDDGVLFTDIADYIERNWENL